MLTQFRVEGSGLGIRKITLSHTHPPLPPRRFIMENSQGLEARNDSRALVTPTPPPEMRTT